MSRSRGISPWEAVRESIRELVAFILAVVLVIPAAIIKLIDLVTLWWIRRHGGLN